MGTTAAPTATATPASRLGFRPDIEGLRAVAVGLVVLLHAGVTTVSGGYVGVDVFFVISGFLITGLLIDEVRFTGRVSILGFYARRARRILPAACFVIACTVVAAYLSLGPLDGRATALDGRWAAVFAANFRFIRQGTDYFASSLPPSPLQHYWSLAVEEQFYFVWPSLLFGLAILGRRLRQPALTLRIGLGAIVAVSLYWSIHQSAHSPTTAYFSPLTRAWELGFGALVAALPIAISRIPALVRAIVSWIGLALIAWAAFTFTAATVFPGSAALIPVGGAALVVAGGIGTPRGGAGMLLGLPPLRWIGQISFSIYLWHWPVLTIARERTAAPLSYRGEFLCVLITLALSIATYVVIEHPLRKTGRADAKRDISDWRKARKPLEVGAIAIVVALVTVFSVGNRAFSAIDQASSQAKVRHSISDSIAARIANPTQRIAYLEHTVRTRVQEGLSLHSVPGDLNPPVLQIQTAFDQRFKSCTQSRVDSVLKPCIFGAAKSKKTLVVFGDSHAMEWMPALDPFARRAGYRIVALYKSSCPVPALPTFTITGFPYPQCETWRKKALTYIRSLHPAAVIIGFTQAFTGKGGEFDLPAWRVGLRTSLRALGTAPRRIIEIGPNTFLPQDPGLCLSRPGADPARCTAGFWRRDIVDAELAVMRQYGAGFIDTERWFCINARCPVIIDHRIAYADDSHVSAQYVRDLEPLVVTRLQLLGLS